MPLICNETKRIREKLNQIREKLNRIREKLNRIREKQKRDQVKAKPDQVKVRTDPGKAKPETSKKQKLVFDYYFLPGKPITSLFSELFKSVAGKRPRSRVLEHEFHDRCVLII